MSIKKILLGGVMSAMALTTGIAPAKAAEPCDNGVYMAVRSGVAMIDNHIDKNAWMGSLAIGAKNNAVRTELEYSYRDEIKGTSNDVRHKIGSMSLMANGYYDFYTGTMVHPYVNLGIGATRLKLDTDGDGKTAGRFTWGGGAGVGFDLSHNMAIDVGYRFLDLGRDITSNEFYGGLRFAF